jgi:hypothetical protein
MWDRAKRYDLWIVAGFLWTIVITVAGAGWPWSW